MREILVTIFICLTILSYSQESDSLRKYAPKVYIDCNFCDEDYIRQNITCVNYVRDRKVADVHLLVTEQETGSGGEEFSLTFIGQNKFSHMSDTLSFTTKPDNTSDEIRNIGNQYILMGLIPYIARTPIAKMITIDFEEEIDFYIVEDKWNNWVFNLYFSGWFRNQETIKSSTIYGSIEGDHVTPNWKIELDLIFNKNIDKYILADETITGFSSRKYFSGLIVKSINEHWSFGGYSNLYSSYYQNIKMAYQLSPALEYNLFPYTESTRKQLRFLYKLEGIYNAYNDTTLYNKMEESLFAQSFSVALTLKQPWGSVNSSLNGSHYFHDPNLNRLSLRIRLDFRVFKGFSVYFSASESLIHDQIELPKDGVSDEEVLLTQRQLATQYSYQGSLGLTYTFGSIYNNIVNPRFGN